jgi:hypothetical protein
MDKPVQVRFAEDKETTRTIRFQEKLEDPMDTPVIGTLYVPKATLKVLGYKQGAALVVTLAVD